MLFKEWYKLLKSSALPNTEYVSLSEKSKSGPLRFKIGGWGIKPEELEESIKARTNK